MTNRTVRPKHNARKTIRNMVRDHLFNLSLNHLKRTKRFLNSFYSAQYANYYRTRPIYQSLDTINQPKTSYRTIPLRTSYSSYLNNRMNINSHSPIISPLNSPSNLPIVNINPSIEHHSANNNPSINSNYDHNSFTTENSNAYSLPNEFSSTTNPSTTTDKSFDEDTNSKLKQECAGSILSNRYILSAAHVRKII